MQYPMQQAKPTRSHPRQLLAQRRSYCSYVLLLSCLLCRISWAADGPDETKRLASQILAPNEQISQEMVPEPPPQPWTPEQSTSHSAILLQQFIKTCFALALVLGLLWLLKGLWLQKWATALRTGKQGRMIIHDSLRLDEKHTLYFIGLDTDTEILLGVSAQQGIATIWKRRTDNKRGGFARQLADNQGSDDVPF